MATTPITTIKNWFKTGLKPSQAQFWAWLDSYRHKDDAINQSDIEGLSNTLNAKAEKSQLQGHIDLSKETNVTTGGNKNNLVTATKFIRFSNMVDPTILSGIANATDGDKAILVNNTLQSLPLLHESASSLDVNRMLNINKQDLFIVVGGTAEYVYSGSLKRWVLKNIWATDYFASLIGEGKRAMAVTAQGYATAETIVDLKIWDTAKTTAYTKNEINAAYPALTKGQQVVCPNIPGEGLVFEKYDDSSGDWFTFKFSKIT